ncbi:potassium channel subfamily T member 1 [Elysia marginata]|uniref:Potassium channel subfamily T member 1 n=1 Tax=Elysia marginata TaxID=1093978 RepID=A0AAV4HP82_9GAST|nr:potassium channel subfamily T member 1 [Elysia marginata]
MSVTLSQQSWFLIATLACLIFTTICGIQHIQRGSHEKPLNMFEAVYFVIVTLSTVGYGDISPDIWLGQLFMLVMICVAFSFIPRQLEEIGSTWSQRKKMGGDYTKRAASRGKHVVVIGSEFSTDSVMNFLHEFYEHPKLEHFTVIFMSSEELDNNMQFILKDPKWANRVLYIRGSALKDIDLKRCRINEAEACFFLVNKNSEPLEKTDQHTILRSWAVKDFAPNCAQYIQLLKASNKIHVKFAEHVVSEDEFKFALLANNCLYPGLSTLVTLILHTSRGQEGTWATETWQKIYGSHSGNEIYHILLGRSVFFQEYEGKKFTFASVDAHQKYGVSLIAVLDTTSPEAQLQLNPGPDHILKASDYCFYMSLTREENVKVPPATRLPDAKNTAAEIRKKNIDMIVKWMKEYDGEHEEVEEESVFSTITSNIGSSLAKSMRQGLEGIPLLRLSSSHNQGEKSPSYHSKETKENLETFDRVHGATIPSKIVQHMIDLGQESFTIGPPPSTLNMGTRRTLCHLHKESRMLCCLEWGKACQHCPYKVASDRRWDGQLVILSVRRSCSGLYNFIIPLRSNYLSQLSLMPLIIMFEETPTRFFLETIAHFPLVFWMQGSLTSIDDLLVAGVNKAMHLVIGHIEVESTGEENLSDAETIVTVQKISRMFPHVNIITEVTEAANMRFMHFKAKDTYMLQIRQLEKNLKERTTSHLPYMFRLPFAAGKVFSSGMLDRLLYQTFVKGYLISFVRLLLGIDAEKNSGHLSSVCIQRATLSQFPNYGDLYQGLCSTTGEIPIAIYRTEKHNVGPAEVTDQNGNGTQDQQRHNNISPSHRSKWMEAFRSNARRFSTKSAPTVSFTPSPPSSPTNGCEDSQGGTSSALSSKLKSSRVSMSARLFSGDHHSNRHLEEMVQARMESLGLAHYDRPYVIQKSEKTLSYVIVNPSPKRKLKTGDIVYVIQPSSMQAVPNKLNRSGRSITTKYLRKRTTSTGHSSHSNSNHSNAYSDTSAAHSHHTPHGVRPQSGDSASNTSGGGSSQTQHSPVRAAAISGGKSLGAFHHPVKWLDIQGVATDTDEDDLSDDTLEEMRPRCQSESCSDRKNGCVKVKTQLSQPNTVPIKV